MLKYIWIGKYESDILQDEIFIGSITMFGSNRNTNYSFFESFKNKSFDYNDFISFIAEKSELVLSENKNCKLYFYNPSWAYDILKTNKNLINYIANELNPKKLIDFLNDKAMSRLWISNIVKIPPFVVLSKNECTYKNIKTLFDNSDTFIVQQNVSEGGEGTFLLNEKNDISNLLSEFETFLVSPFLEKSISLNVTLICNKNKEYVAFPISEQIFDSKNNYIGSDFIAGDNIYKLNQKNIDNFISKIAEVLLKNSYTGICGIDFLLHNDDLYFIEFNPRFQGSSFLLNIWLKNCFKLSLYELNLNYFNSSEIFAFKQDIKNTKLLNSYINCSSKMVPDDYDRIITDGKITKIQRAIFSKQIIKSDYGYTSNDYYNYFATKYKLILPDYEKMIQTQGDVLSKIFINYAKIKVKKVLDCTCGIGVQTISLAKQNYKVCGSDISQKELEVAKMESKKRKLDIKYYVADCQDLQSVFIEKFDAIISIDSALPHLLTKDNFYRALNSIYNQLKKGGVFLASFRDYKKMLEEKPLWAYPPRYRKTEEQDIIIIRSLDWDNDICESHQYYIENDKKIILNYIIVNTNNGQSQKISFLIF